MCGISGIAYFPPAPSPANTVLEKQIDAMTASLKHRGPDGQGTYCDPDFSLALGHTRLAIRDLSAAGHQPMISDSGRYVLVYNGEIYSQTEIEQELTLQTPMQGHSDTRLLLNTCAEWGVEKTLPYLIGKFAFALWDRTKQTLYLVRDRLGIKPLYWSYQAGCLRFGSELKALQASSLVDRALDRDSLLSFMRHNYIPHPYTIYPEVHQLSPGHMLKISLAQPQPEISAYWNLRQYILSQNKNPQERGDPLKGMQALLRDAVQRRMISDVPIGAFLSGGIDSSLITALMMEHSGQPIHTFSIAFQESDFNEAPFAAKIAQHLGTEHTELTATAQDLLDIVPQIPIIYDEPFADSSQIPTVLLCALTKKTVSVALSGDGGDEVFAGYNRYLFCDKIHRIPTLLRPLITQVCRAYRPEQWDSFFKKIHRLLPSALCPAWFKNTPQIGQKLHKLAQILRLGDTDSVYRHLISQWVDQDALHKIVLHAAERQDSLLWDPTLSQDLPNPIDRMQFMDTLSYLPDDILTKVDRASMAFGLEVRVPLLDHRVVEYAWTLPRHYKIQAGRSKWILRELLRQYVPPALFERPKMGFGIPLDAWLRGPLREWAESLLQPHHLNKQGLFDTQRLLHQWRRHLQGDPHGTALWSALMALSWIQRHPELELSW